MRIMPSVVAVTVLGVLCPPVGSAHAQAIAQAVSEAPTGFDNQTNGFIPQGPPFDSLHEDNVVPLRSFNDNRFIFEEFEAVDDGLGPVYNAQGCRECHQNVVTGGASQITEQRAAFENNGRVVEAPGGSLIHSRAIHPDLIEQLYRKYDVRTFRLSTNTLGAGFVECIDDATLTSIRDNQPADVRGTAVPVPVLEARDSLRIGRFGWKSQHASLESFSADAYLNEMGITTPLLPDDNSSNGRDVSAYDHVDDPEDDGVDVEAFADFIRATKAPPRGEITASVRAGELLFSQIGCVACHAPALTTAPAGTPVNGGAFVVPAALGNKVIHPYSDFLLHDIETGDGIPVSSAPEHAATAAQMRTAPLWGLRTRNRLMHDGLSFTKDEAIQRHGGQAAAVRQKYRALQPVQQQQIEAFLNSL